MDFSLDVSKGLCARAHAQREWPGIGFSDQSAMLLAHLLGINLKQRLPPIDERHLIERCQWFDERCRDFFWRHPHALCIELGAGLSTRFHRLSDTADWPRFQWVDVDLPHITASKAGVLPPIDNYRLVGADIMQDDWLSLSGWKPGQPLLILMEGVAPEIEGELILQLICRLRQRAGSAQELELVFDDRNPNTWRLWLKALAVGLGAGFTLPITRYLPALEYLDFRVTRQQPLLGRRALGLVINYINLELV